MEADANWWLDSPDGVEIGGSGLSATLRDFARLGQFFLEGGVIDGSTILPDGWTETAGQPQKLKSGETIDYGYMWWPGRTEPSIANGAFAAIGIKGQNININPEWNVVIATDMAQPKPLGREPVDPHVVFDAISAALDLQASYTVYIKAHVHRGPPAILGWWLAAASPTCRCD
ncbi:hypothetical protein FHD67_19060 [Paracoccus haeundaensis]|uniref:Serine hydrolase n=1 Tax=Paracoccus haeundaensis TaxID=225362 RepID=A0A5C4R1N4_9RHOB|nr:hypothetical protein FHD67_19060 [Paracoccus haeundaensis]